MISLDRSEHSTLLKAALPLRPRYIWTERLRISKKMPENNSPVFAPEDKDSLVGYMVCRIDDTCVRVEHIFILEGYRRKSLASMLFQKAEEIAASMGEETVYNYVHPNNEGMIRFLRSKGYTVLNPIEIRKPYANEKLTTTIQVDKETFDY